MAEYERTDRQLTDKQAIRILERAASVGGAAGDWRAFYGGEVPSHDPVTGQKNSNAGDPRPGYLRLTCAAQGVTEGQIAAVVDGWNVMPLQTDKTQIAADGVEEATISLVYSPLAGDTVVDWELFLDGESITSGTRAVSGDTMTPFTFNTDEAGVYEFEVRRQSGYESGIVIIQGV